MNPYLPRIDPPNQDGPPEYHSQRKQIWDPHAPALCDYDNPDYLTDHGQNDHGQDTEDSPC